MTKCTAENLAESVGLDNRFTGVGRYDAAGNMVQNGAYVFNAENQIAWLSGDPGKRYVYDSDGMRSLKCTAWTNEVCTAGVLYWYGAGGDPLAESDLAGNLSAEYIYFGGRIARVDLPTAAAHYYVSDHLGSATVIASEAGVQEREEMYFPYGGERWTSGTDPNHYKFTGKERDAETGLDYFGARYFSSTISRFMSPDWAPNATAVPYANYGNPQSLNLYGYVRNNPTTTADPDGHNPANAFNLVCDLSACGGGSSSAQGTFMDMDGVMASFDAAAQGQQQEARISTWERVRMGAQGFLDGVAGVGKLAAATAAAISTPVTGPFGAAGAAYGGISGTGQLVGGAFEIVGAFLPSNLAKDFQTGANVSMAITTVAGAVTLVRTGDPDKAAAAATIEDLGTRLAAPKAAHLVQDLVIDGLGLVPQPQQVPAPPVLTPKPAPAAAPGDLPCWHWGIC